MADSNPPPPEPSPEDGEDGKADRETAEEEEGEPTDQKQPENVEGSSKDNKKTSCSSASTKKEGEQGDDAAKTAGEEGGGGENAEDEDQEKTTSAAKQEKREIPTDFYYDSEEHKSGPLKSDDDLPETLLNLFHSFGYECRMRNNLHALSNGRLIFSAGRYLQILHLDPPPDYRFTFMRTTGGGSIGAITVHPTGKYFAIGEKGSNPDVNVYDAEDYRLYRILRNGTTTAYKSLCFNEKGDLLASQGSEPDHMLTVWNWIQEAILLRCKAFSQEVNHVSFNRELQGKLCTAGSGHIKFWTMARTFTGLKLQGQVGRFGRNPISDIEGFLEFPDGKVLTGSDWGNLLLWDEQLIKVQIGRKNGRPCHAGQVMQMMMVEGEIITAGTDGYVRSWNFELIDMLEAAEESGLVEMDPMNEVLIGASAQLYYLTQPPNVKTRKITDFTGPQASLSFEGDEATRHRWFCQDGAGGIWQADLSFRLAAIAPKRLLNFHAGAITACAVSPKTYLVITLGEDGTLRLYEIVKKKLLAVIQFKAKGCSLVWIPISVDNHCASVMAGFSDGVIRRVAIDGATTTVFGVNRMECQLKLLQALKPHSSTVTDLAYSRSAWAVRGRVGNLCSLATCSEDQTIFFFNVFSQDEYQPHCYVPLQQVPRHVIWSTDEKTRDHLLLLCDDSIVIEMVEPRVVNTVETLEYCNIQMRALKFLSIKSQLQHDEELEQERKLQEEQDKEREEQNKELVEKGLETASQQNLRIANEDTATAAEKKMKEEREEPWSPYIPPIPSPILQAQYSKGGGTFWLLLGDYDAGYFYECQFAGRFRMCHKDDAVQPLETAPLRAVPIMGGVDDVITAMKINADGQFLFVGTQDGCIRVLFLETEYDLASQSKFWSLGVHDMTSGAVQGLAINHNEAFLVTVGRDGNFFIFSMFSENDMDRWITCDKAEVPVGTGSADEAKVEDLGPDSYTIEQHKQKSDQDQLIRQAEKRKQERRIEIAKLRAEFMQLQSRNWELPVRQRLTPDEFVMDRSLLQEAEEQRRKKLELLHKELAWETEKAELGYKKVYDYYRKNVLCDFFCVRALSTAHVIYSYRLEKTEQSILPGSTRVLTVHSEHDLSEDSSKDAEDLEAELTGLVGSLFQLEDIAGANERIQYLLKKVHMKRVKRAKRKIAWRKFLATKPADDLEDPLDLEAIQRAKDLLGDLPLKSDSSYVVPDSYRLTMADGAKRLHDCQSHLQNLQMNFNKRLLALRDEKVQTLAAIRKRLRTLAETNDRLDQQQIVVMPKCPTMALDEKPGGQFKIDAKTEALLKDEARQIRRIRLEQQRRESKESAFLKSNRKSSVAIAKENMSRRQSIKSAITNTTSPTTPMNLDIEESESEGATGRVSRVGDVGLLFASPLWEDLKAVEQIKLKYQQSVILKEIEEKTQLFDMHHRQLRHEKFELDVLVKAGQMRLTTLQEEQLLLMECEHVEKEIQQRIDQSRDQKIDADKSVKQLQTQLSKLVKDIEENAKKDKALFTQVESMVGDNNPFHDYLVKVYKKRVKRKNVTHRVDKDDSDSSESESDSSSDSEESDEDDEDAIHPDLNVCPPNCSEELYNKVIVLREERLDLDEQATEMKRNRENMVKDMEALAKKKQATEAVLTKGQKELIAFQLEKQKRVNDLYTVCSLQLHQIQCLRRNGEFRALTDELLLTEDELLRLQNRILELKDEKKDEKRKTIERRKLHVHLQHERRLFLEKLADTEETCQKEMMKKFGQIVDIETVEAVVADPQVEDVRSRLQRIQRDSDKEMRASCKQLSDLKRSNVHSLRLDADYKTLEAEMKVRLIHLEKDLDQSLGPVSKKTNIFQDDVATEPKDLHKLMDVVGEQREVIKSLLDEIKYLQQGAPPTE